MRKFKKSEIISIIILTSAIIAISVSFFQNIILLLPLVTGLLFYLIYIQNTNIESIFGGDYLQTGEGFLAVIAFFISIHYLYDKFNGTLLFSFILIFLYQILLRLLTDPKKKDDFLYGTIINIIVIGTFSFIILNDTTFDSTLLMHIIWGFGQYTTISISLIIALNLFLVLILILMFIFKPYTLLFSHGESFFRETGYRDKIIKIIFIMVRAVALFGTIFFLGLKIAFGLYILSLIRGRANFVITVLILFLLLLLLSIIETYIDQFWITTVIALMSYVFFSYISKKRLCIYDRS